MKSLYHTLRGAWRKKRVGLAERVCVQVLCTRNYMRYCVVAFKLSLCMQYMHKFNVAAALHNGIVSFVYSNLHT